MGFPCLLSPILALSLATLVLIWWRMRRLEQDTGLTLPPRQGALEFAHSKGDARVLTQHWGSSGCERVRMQLHLDFGFIAAYAIAGVAGALLAAHALPAVVCRVEIGTAVAEIWLVAATLDVVENVLLLQVLPPHDRASLQPVAFVAVVLKWTFVIVGALAIALMLLHGRGAASNSCFLWLMHAPT